MFLAVIGLAAFAEWAENRYWWMPSSVKAIVGNVLWSGGSFCALAALRPHWTTRSLALTTLALSLVVELSHLGEWRALEAYRSHGLGRALLGSRFHWSDLIANIGGVIIASGSDVLLRPEKRRR
jgi:hypothetical protein